MNKITLRGTEYLVNRLSDIEMVPLNQILALSVDDEIDQDKIAERIINRLMHPSNHAAIAYVVSKAIPTIPESIVKYSCIRLPDGSVDESNSKLGIDVEELTPIIQAINEERTMIAPAIAPVPAEIVHVTKPDPNAEAIAKLEAQIMELKNTPQVTP